DTGGSALQLASTISITACNELYFADSLLLGTLSLVADCGQLSCRAAPRLLRVEKVSCPNENGN
ncbi:MAG: hypothetical protein PF486_04220, partial [Prolixibacteraceae bacterium]|nr:hypothetical protein [Prolixibacteraceae bacterium]